MILYSEVEHYGQEYILMMKSLKTSSVWHLFSKVHLSDVGKDPSEYEHPLLTPYYLGKERSKIDLEGYLVESVKCVFSTASTFHKGFRILTEIIDVYTKSKFYGYSELERRTKRTERIGKVNFSFLEMKSDICFHKSISADGVFQELSFGYGDKVINFKKLPYNKIGLNDLKYTSITATIGEDIFSSVNINLITFEQILDNFDLSWYYDKDKGEFKKDYKEISSLIQFESQVMTPMINHILKEIRAGRKPLIALDTETTGLIMQYLKDNNPQLDRCVSVQLSWDYNQAVCIYTDMEYFSNVDNDYVLRRLSELFRWTTDEEFEMKLFFDEEGNRLDEPRIVKLKRTDYLLANHNIMFDSKVFRRHGHLAFFDIDTLQMAFTLNPTSFKRTKGLKELVKKLLGISYPTLTDLLGKGNEGKFRFLNDNDVAVLYGCADVDLLRFVYDELRTLMGENLYNAYMAIDSYTNNVLAEMEYYGVRVDKEQLSQYASYVKQDLETLENLIYEHVGKMLTIRTSQVKGVQLTKEEYENAPPYKFKLGGKEAPDVFYEYLNYPCYVYTDKGNKALNSFSIKRLLRETNTEPVELLSQDIPSAVPDSEPLIKKDKFNKFKYPLAYLFKEYKVLLKEYDAYYKPFSNSDTEDRIFKPVKGANIETRRTSSALQIVKKAIKRFVKSHLPDWNLCDFDMAQIEARVMVSLANDTVMIKKLSDPDMDYHTENGALINDIPPHLLPKDLRTAAKSVGFGVPYGLSEYKLCERIYTEVTPSNLLKTRILLDKFSKANHVFMDALLKDRAMANKEAVLAPELRKFLDLEENRVVAIVYNANGFYRYQDITDKIGDAPAMASVERAFGNYPIQSYAADLFKVVYCRLHRRIRKEGLQDKVIFHLPIHDEILFSFHKSVNPEFIVRMIKEECMIKLKGHTPYFLGINFGESWYECKQDSSELPVKFVQRLCKQESSLVKEQFCDSPAEYFKPKVIEFKKDRILECLKLYRPNLVTDKLLNLDDILDDFANYTVRSYTYDVGLSFNPTIKDYNEKGKPVYDTNEFTLSAICKVLVDRDLEDCNVIFKGEVYSISQLIELRSSSEYLAPIVAVEEEEEEDFDFNDDFYASIDEEESFWSFDEGESFSDKFVFVKEYDTDEDFIKKKVELFDKKAVDNYKYISNIGKTKVITLDSYSDMTKVSKLLENYVSKKSGSRVKFKYGSGGFNVPPLQYDLPSDSKLDELINSHLNRYKLKESNKF